MSGPTRRELLALAGVAAGCSNAKAEVVRGACHHDCPDACAWEVTAQGGQLVKIEGAKRHPYTHGELCGKMNRFLDDVVLNPARLLYPLKRIGAKGQGKFQRVSWDQALDDVAARLKRIIQESGATAILPYSDAGTIGLVQSSSLDRRFFARLGASRLEENICGGATEAGWKATLGTGAGILPEDIVHSKFIIIWGANPAVTAPHSWRFVEQARSRGAKIVTIDPLRSLSAEGSHVHLQLIPGTDAALALGMMHVIVQENLYDHDFVEKHTIGFAPLRERLREYPPQRAAELTGLKVTDIVATARAYAKAKPSTIRTLIGMEHRANGAMTFRTVTCLPALTGAWRERGGGMLGTTSQLFTLNWNAVVMPELIKQETRSINMVQIGRALTDKNLDPPLRAMIVYDSNPATIAPNQNLVLQGLRREDLFTVVLEHFMTDTARFADYVFPSTTQVEQLDLMYSWGQHYLALNQPAIKPMGEAAPNTEFFRRLGAKMGFQEKYLFDSDEQVIRSALNSNHPFLKGITYERLAAEGWAPLNLPDPWTPFAQGQFPTKSGKCEFYSEDLKAKGMDPLPAYVPVRERRSASYPLQLLISKAARNFLNSSYAGVEPTAKDEGEPRLKIHPDDAKLRGIIGGERVRVFNGRGTMVVRALVTSGVRVGVVAMPHGFWGSRMPGGSSPNALTPDGLSDLGGGGEFHDARVQVAKA